MIVVAKSPYKTGHTHAANTLLATSPRRISPPFQGLEKQIWFFQTPWEPRNKLLHNIMEPLVFPELQNQ
jgi:hypothetical protein